MRKAKPRTKNDIRDEYDFSGGVRGKYATRCASGSNVVVLDPEVAAVFTDSVQVNRLLKAVLAAIPAAGHAP